MSLFTISRRPCARRTHDRAGPARLQQLRRHGFTLVELSVSMAISAIVVVASLTVLRQQLDQAQVSSSSFFLRQTLVSLQDFFVGGAGAAAIDNSTLANGGAVARQYVGGGTGPNTRISNTWGGRMFVGQLNAGSNADWVLQVSGLPMRLCPDIVHSLESSLNAGGLRHALAGSPTTGAEIATQALASVSLNPGRLLHTLSPTVYILKESPYVPISPAALTSLCETRQPYFNLFLTSNNNAL
ncbi:type II secretion system protein [Herbaspirillum sp. NPDC087042]|uniref:type II secretion system protein n=1 Tax=Herbaspirillum sp. NPDC087042 TaxID=3364004 RepID=UPI00382FAEA0